MKHTKESLIKLAEGSTVFRTEAALQTLKDALEFALDELFAERDALLAILNDCVDCLQNEIWDSGEDDHPYVSLVKTARAAIAKAEGEMK